MKSTRLGCLSAPTFFAVLVTLLLVAGVGLARGGVLFSPGELSSVSSGRGMGGVLSHAQLAGRCSACHAPFWSRDKMADRCLDCHTNLVEDPKNFHVIMMAQAETATCRQCHTDHKGPQTFLAAAALEGFPHEASGFALSSHQRRAEGSAFVCQDCHPAGFSSFDQEVCSSCHQKLDRSSMQAHRAAFGANCIACHDGVETFGASFTHSRTAFPLQGKHAAVACRDCHAGATSLSELHAAPRDCSGCHARDDVHGGALGEDCAQCHTPEQWQGAAFDHSQTGFPLAGMHASVACQDCHVKGPTGAVVYAGLPADCAACHAKDDAHAGQFGEDCAACHSPSGWQGATFDHSRAAFQLTGAHANVECTQCHKDGVFKGTPQACAACHAEPQFHQGLFNADCAACHTTAAWSPAQFKGPHLFPLNHGAHAASDCKLCHPAALQAYTCYGCHAHSRAGIESKHREEGISNFRNCVRCHPTGREGDGEGGEGGDD